MQQIFSVNMHTIHEADGMTGLPVFMLAATGSTSDIKLVYKLLREHPPEFIYLINDGYPDTTIGNTRNRVRDKFVRKKRHRYWGLRPLTSAPPPPTFAPPPPTSVTQPYISAPQRSIFILPPNW